MTGNTHRQHLSWSQIILSDDKKSAEIIHRLHEHDSTALLRKLGFKNPNLGSLEQLAALALHVSRQTQITQQNSRQAKAEIIGAEAEGKFVFIYQEIAQQNSMLAMIHTQILMDINADQVNQVNIEHRGEIRSLQFNRQNEAKAIDRKNEAKALNR
jgi:hypothetical protein